MHVYVVLSPNLPISVNCSASDTYVLILAYLRVLLAKAGPG